jgi:hypothetical protein
MKYLLHNNMKNKNLSFKPEIISICICIQMHIKKKCIRNQEYFLQEGEQPMMCYGIL